MIVNFFFCVCVNLMWKGPLKYFYLKYFSLLITNFLLKIIIKYTQILLNNNAIIEVYKFKTKNYT